MEVLRLQLEINDLPNYHHDKYKNIYEADSIYSTPQYKEAYTNYRKSKSGNYDNDLLQMMVSGLGDSFTHAMRNTFFKNSFENAVKSALDDYLRKELKGIATVTD